MSAEPEAVSPLNDREKFIRDNAVALVYAKEAKISRQRKTLAMLHKGRYEQGRAIRRLALENERLQAACAIFEKNSANATELWMALRELLTLKELKDREGKTKGYRFRQPRAWERARQLVTEKGKEPA